jgi:hypothetical protein
MADDAGRFQAPAVAADHPRVGSGFIKEHQPMSDPGTEQDVPPQPLLAYVRPPLFGGVQNFF